MKLGRWFYCKYCYKNIRPQMDDEFVICPSCDHNLAPLDAVEAAGSLQAWYAGLVAGFNAKHGNP